MNYNIRVFHPQPSDPFAVPINANGRTYYPANGVQDVPYSDGSVLMGNGWVSIPHRAGEVRVGTTAERPTSAQTSATNLITAYKNTMFIDTTINKLIFYDGYVWRDHTGAVV